MAYSALSLALLYWLIVAPGAGAHVELWPQDGWMRWLVNWRCRWRWRGVILGGMAGTDGGLRHLGRGASGREWRSGVVLFGLMLAAAFGIDLPAPGRAAA